MLILSRRTKDRVKVSLLHGGSRIKVAIAQESEWRLLRDRLDDAVANVLASLKEPDGPLPPDEAPTIQLNLVCDISHVVEEAEFEECLSTIHRIMDRQHPDDVRLLVLVGNKIRNRFDSVEWSNREACAASHHTTLALPGFCPLSIRTTEGER